LENTMETRPQPTPRPPSAPTAPLPARPTAESSRTGVLVRVSIVNDRHDEEEKEAGYGHGV
jgi:hypothetical protein